MLKKLFLVTVLMGFIAGLSVAHAKDLKINKYYFVWYAANVGDVHMDIEKSPEGVKVVLRNPGGALARISPTPATAVAIGKALKANTGKYYDKQMKNQDYKAQDVVPVGGYTIYFNSSWGQKFEVSVRAPGLLSAAVVMSKDEALKIADHLLDAEKMAALVNKGVHP
jgi:hypothetical protein